MKLHIVIAANGEKTLKSLVQTYISFYSSKVELSIFIYDSKFDEYCKLDFTECANVIYNKHPEAEDSLEKYARYIELIEQNPELVPDLVIRGTADDIFLNSISEMRELAIKSNRWSFIRTRDIINFESIQSDKFNDGFYIRSQIMNNKLTIDQDSINVKQTNAASRHIQIHYYGLHTFKLFYCIVSWQIMVAEAFPEAFFNLTEVLISVPFRGCKGRWSNYSLYINQRSPKRAWGNQLTGRAMKDILKKNDSPINLVPLLEKFRLRMQSSLLINESLPVVPQPWLTDVSDLRSSDIIFELHRCKSAWQRLGYYAFELICTDWGNSSKTIVTTENSNKNNLKICYGANNIFREFCLENFYFNCLGSQEMSAAFINIEKDFFKSLAIR